MPANPHRELFGYFAAIGTAAIWTGFILLSRAGGRTALTPYDLVVLRLGTSAVLLLPFAGSLPLGAWRDPKLWTLAMLGGLLYSTFVFAGFKHAPAGHGAILLPGQLPFLITLMAWIVTGVRPSRERIAGLASIGIGVAALAAPSVLGSPAASPTMVGDALILASALSWAVYSVLAKFWGYEPWVLTRFVALGSALVFVPVYVLWLPKALTEVPISMLVVQALYQGIGPNIVAMFLFLQAVHALGAERAGALIAIVPALVVIGAAALLKEPLTVPLLVGLAFVSAGALLASRPVQRNSGDPA
jgi:drug/metabolite transporter (DMT)-like permease